uniref:MetA-pathway of phenol degradation n=1 Tax=Candidatus Kentrum eta TaxID=2126337 RepID=A0A450UID6_9GAMM|nr:MAG: hypothetical protein BECKH772A_GA0070896_1004114 [Candidatus Kentron sp. H]VFJ93210.1 MAG: hypothetical protein BECKH772B_GA0070898_1004014 [Candidatus Kentron sp. H]VFK00077.1 MAG: hypothetical protein BECKH772C_GA0070978_1003914 [Candidatus Kentron sp. H]
MKNPSDYPKTPPITGLLLLGFLLLSTGVANADAFSATSRSEVSLPGLSLRLPEHLSKDLSADTNDVEGAFNMGIEQEHGGASGISRIARAYLDYTFLSRRTGNLAQNLQGRIGIVSHSANQSDFPLSPSEQFRPGNPQWAAFPDGNFHDVSGYRTDRGFLASLEWRLDAPGFADKPAFSNLTWGEVLQISFFADYGKAFSNGARSVDAMWMKESKYGLSGAGIGTGLRFSLPGRLTANLKAAYSLQDWDSNGVATNDGVDSDSSRAQYWFDFSYNF